MHHGYKGQGGIIAPSSEPAGEQLCQRIIPKGGRNKSDVATVCKFNLSDICSRGSCLNPPANLDGQDAEHQFFFALFLDLGKIISEHPWKTGGEILSPEGWQEGRQVGIITDSVNFPKRRTNMKMGLQTWIILILPLRSKARSKFSCFP